MATKLSAYDDTLLNEAQKKQIAAYKAAYDEASAAGDTAAMESAHTAAERIRASAGYSGGGDGSGYYTLASGSTYSPSTTVTYTPQTEAAESAYDSATKAAISALKTEYASSEAALEAEREKTAAEYAEKQNSLAAASEREAQSLGERAAASGINSGVGSQQALALSNAYQSSMSDLSASEAEAYADLESRISQLKEEYSAKAAELRAEGEADKAAALLEEYRAAANSAVSASQAQADENYRAYSSASSAAGERAEAESDAYERAAENAATLAKYGDFSGYAAIGYTQEQIEAMEQSWAIQNPLLAYRLGKISAKEYYSIVYG